MLACAIALSSSASALVLTPAMRPAAVQMPAINMMFGGGGGGGGGGDGEEAGFMSVPSRLPL